MNPRHQKILFYFIFAVGFFSTIIFFPNQILFLQALFGSAFSIVISIGVVLFTLLYFGIFPDVIYDFVFVKKHTFLEKNPGVTILANLITKYIITTVWYFMALIPFLILGAGNFHDVEGPTTIIIPAIFLIIIFFYRYGKKTEDKYISEEMKSVIISTAILGAVFTFGMGYDMQNIPRIQTGQLILLASILDMKFIK